MPLGDGTYQADAMTAQPAKTIHAGTNAVISKWSFAATPTGSVAVQLCPIPAGAQITRFALYETGGWNQPVDVRLDIGGTEVGNYVQSSTAAAGAYTVVNEGTTRFGDRVTASAVLEMQLHNATGTGTGVCSFTAITEYIYEQRGD